MDPSRVGSNIRPLVWSRISITMKFHHLLLILAAGCTLHASDNAPASERPLPVERDGFVSVEAEHYDSQEKTSVRAWYLVSAATIASLPPDHDEPHLVGASGGAYLEILPDTRITSKDRLVQGENFSSEPGQMAVLNYRMRFTTPGRYYVWIRCFSTGTEDNGVHVGVNGTWPESGRRWQTTKKNVWHWDSRQRTDANHLGEPDLLFIDIPRAGEHMISFSMREDGFEFDQWALTTTPGFDPASTSSSKLLRLGFAPVERAFSIVTRASTGQGLSAVQLSFSPLPVIPL